MEEKEPVEFGNLALSSVKKQGRPFGSGANAKMLLRLEPGRLTSCIMGLGPKKMHSFRQSAHRIKMKITIRKLEDGTYCIWRR